MSIANLVNLLQASTSDRDFELAARLISSADLWALCRAELFKLKTMIEEFANVANEETLAHLEQILAQIEAALDPKVDSGGIAPTQPSNLRR